MAAKFDSNRLTIRESKLLMLDEFEMVRLDDVIARFTAFRNQYGRDSWFQIETDTYYDNTDVYVRVIWDRKETDAEFAAREANYKNAAKHKRDEAKKRRQDREARDLAEFERLSKKFSKK